MATSTNGPAGPDAGIVVGRLLPADLEEVVSIDRTLTGHPRRRFFERRLAAAIAEPGRYVYVAARREGRLVGYALARLTDGEFGAGMLSANLDAIGVAEGRAGGGVGTRLLGAVEEVLRHKGVAELVAEVAWSHQELLRFFGHHGFELAPRVVLARETAAPLNI